MRVHFSGRAFDYQTLRALSYTTFGGAEPGEVLMTAERIAEGDTASWHDEWRRTAERVERLAVRAREAGNERTARDAGLRAHTYYRTAEFFLDPADPRRLPTYRASRAAFREALPALDADARRVDIPYEGTTLPGYRFLPPGADPDGSRPTVVCLGGFDSLCEELYFLCGVPEALARGYAVLTFEGPGQGSPLREAGLTARPDWEHVVGPVLDYLDGEPWAGGPTGLVGASFGGYYAPRAAAFEERVDAVVAFDHMHDLPSASAGGNETIARLLLRAPDAIVNGLAALGTRLGGVEARWLMANSRWVFGVASAAELGRTLRRFSLVDVAGEIDCPTLVLAGEDDHFVPFELASEFADLVSGPTTVRVFRTEEGAGEHCQMGNLRLATGEIYDWLGGVL
jgi:pimeloyl-ACP methyl ester carboxylesterase